MNHAHHVSKIVIGNASIKDHVPFLAELHVCDYHVIIAVRRYFLADTSVLLYAVKYVHQLNTAKHVVI
jgi:DNA phosphorothioation-dependent restriction protein DptG